MLIYMYVCCVMCIGIHLLRAQIFISDTYVDDIYFPETNG